MNPGVGQDAPPSTLQQKDFLDHGHHVHVKEPHNSLLLQEIDRELSGQNCYHVHGGQ